VTIDKAKEIYIPRGRVLAVGVFVDTVISGVKIDHDDSPAPGAGGFRTIKWAHHPRQGKYNYIYGFARGKVRNEIREIWNIERE